MREQRDGAGSRGPTGAVARAATVLAAVVVLAALLLPRGILTPGAFLRIPVEALLGVALLLVLPVRSRAVAAGALGAALGLLRTRR